MNPTLMWLLICVGLSVVGCRAQQSFVEPEPSLERMLQQPRLDPFEGSRFYRDGLGMRRPPAGAVPVERRVGEPLVTLGVDDGTYAQRIPIRVDRIFLERGRERFEIVCGACHGIPGDGVSVVAENMDIRKPPSLHEPRIRALPVGRLYEIVRIGYGLMPAYAALLSVEDRWAVVAYLRALQLSRNVQAAALPKNVRADLEREGR